MKSSQQLTAAFNKDIWNSHLNVQILSLADTFTLLFDYYISLQHLVNLIHAILHYF